MIKMVMDPVPRKCPKWAALSFYEKETGEIYLPAIIGGDSEMTVLLAVGFDQTPILMEDNHPYVPLSWLEAEYPKKAKVFERIRTQVALAREHS